MAGGVAGPGEVGEGALHHCHLQLIDVSEVPVDGGGGDPEPPGHPAQRQRAVVAGLADHLAGRGDDLLPQPVALAAPVPPPRRGRNRLDARRHHGAAPAAGPRRRAPATGRLVTASRASTATVSTEVAPPAARSRSPASPPCPPVAPNAAMNTMVATPAATASTAQRRQPGSAANRAARTKHPPASAVIVITANRVCSCPCTVGTPAWAPGGYPLDGSWANSPSSTRPAPA